MSRIHEYLPETLKDVIDLRLLNEDLDIELEQLDGYITGIGKEVIVKSASLYGIEKWEKALGITPKDGDSLETRRFRVNNLLTSKLPYTYRWLIKKLTQITGSPSGYTLNINQDDYAITIVLSGLDTNMMIEVQKQLRNAIPSNMVLEIGGPPLVSADIKVGTALRIGTKYIIKSAKTGLPAGKNVLNIFLPTETRYGVTITNTNNVYKINGTATALVEIMAYVDLSKMILKNGQQYTFSANQQLTNCQFTLELYNGAIWKKEFTYITGNRISSSAILNIDGCTRMRLCLKVPNGNMVDLSNITLQLEEGSIATNYEPFIEL